MIVNMLQTIDGLNGKPLKMQSDEIDTATGAYKQKDLTLREALSQVLLGTLPNENPSPSDKLKFMALALRIYNEDDCDLRIEDAQTILERSGLLSSTIAHGRIDQLLNGIAQGDGMAQRLPADTTPQDPPAPVALVEE